MNKSNGIKMFDSSPIQFYNNFRGNNVILEGRKFDLA
jgi:hypothetical protein